MAKEPTKEALRSARAALVTGGARRLGKAVALALAREGFSVAVQFRSGEAEAAETVAELRALGSDAEAFRADFREPGSAARLLRAARERFGGLDLLVHGASPFAPRKLAEVTEEEWDETFAAVAKAGFFLAQAAEETLRESEGSVVFLSDVAARQAWPRFVPHGAAKAALEALVRSLAVALAPRVRVNAVAPGVVLPPDGMDPAEVARLVERTPLKRRVEVEDVVAAVLFLARNRSITGQVLDVDGGRGIPRSGPA